MLLYWVKVTKAERGNSSCADHTTCLLPHDLVVPSLLYVLITFNKSVISSLYYVTQPTQRFNTSVVAARFQNPRQFSDIKSEVSDCLQNRSEERK